MKKMLIATVMILSILTVEAQISHTEQGTADPKASELLKKAATKLEQNVSFEVAMTVLDAKQNQQLRQEASVLYHRGKYRLVVADQEVVSDGKTVWQWNKATNEVAISNASEDDIDLFNPARMLKNYGNSFRAKYIRTDDNGISVVDLQPRSARSFHKIRLMIDERTALLKRMEVHRFDSSRENYDFSGFKVVNTPASRFVFNTANCPNAEIIDMR